MSQLLTAGIYRLTSCPTLLAFASVVGKKEGEGPLGSYFDKINTDTTMGEQTWEKAESRLQKDTVSTVLSKAKLSPPQIDLLLAGDLLNQCIGSSFGLREFGIPFLGMYGACSTMAEALAIASLLADNGLVQNAVAVTSSHFCSAERQFRFPLEYGGQRTPTSQWTVTGSGAVVITASSKDSPPPYVKGICIGQIQDLGIKDINNMGAAMAPAAADTIKRYLTETSTQASDYDMIITGDLGRIGSDLCIELLKRQNIDLSINHADCGKLIFDPKKQDVHAGGSGCGCSASVLTSFFLPLVQSGKLKQILFVATGALMSTTSIQQGESIPAIAHLVHISNTKD